MVQRPGCQLQAASSWRNCEWACPAGCQSLPRVAAAVAGPGDYGSLVLALGRAQGRLKSLQKQQLTGLADAQRSLEDALGAVLLEEERLWAQARKERTQLQQELATLHDANQRAGRAGTAKIQALWHQLSSLRTRLLASSARRLPAALAQEGADLLARLPDLTLKLTWAKFMPLRATCPLGRLQLETQLLRHPSNEGLACSGEGQGGSSQASEVGGEGQACQGAQLEGGHTHPPQQSGFSELSHVAIECQKRSRGRKGPLLLPEEAKLGVAAEEALLVPRETPDLSSETGKTPGGCLLVAEEGEGQGTGAHFAPLVGEAEGPSLHVTGLLELDDTLFHATAVWIQDDSSDSSSRSTREGALWPNRPPSLPRWASADSLARHCQRPVALGGSCVELPGATSMLLKTTATAGVCLPRLLPPCDQLVGLWGCRGSSTGQLCLPHGLCAVPAVGILFVVDAGNRRLQTLGRGQAWQALSLPGKAPFDVACGRGGCLVVTRVGRDRRVELYTAEGRLLHALAEGFVSPRGVTSYGAHGVAFLVADQGQGALHVLGILGGQLVRQDTVPGFHKPYLVASNARGEVAVSERGLDGGCCVKVLGAGWQVLRVLGTPGGSPPRLTNPWGVALDEAGQVLVADWGRQIHSVVCYPPRGAGWPVATEGLNSPRGVALLGERHLVVADSMHHCLKSFRY